LSLLLSFENFHFKRKVENFPFWKTFHPENIAKVSQNGKLLALLFYKK